MSTDNEVLVKVDGVSKKFCRDLKKSLWYGMKDVASELLPIQNSKSKIQNSGDALRPGEFWANKDISFELRRGECLGLIGRNGAGKTTLLKMLNGLIKPDGGTIEMRGRVGALIALGAGFNPILTGRENIYVNGSVLGLTKNEIDSKMDDIIDFAEIRDFIDSPVQSYSSGMQVRLGFAVATALDPDILILDEVLAVGDAAFRFKCSERISQALKTSAVIFVSHSSALLGQICNRGIVLSRGSTVATGSIEHCLDSYELNQTDSNSLVTNDLISNELLSADFKIPTNCEYGKPLKSQISLTFRKKECRTIHIRYGISQGGQQIAEFIKTITAPEGILDHISITTDNINLASGRYAFDLQILSEDRCKHLFRRTNHDFIIITGSPWGITSYRIPVINE